MDSKKRSQNKWDYECNELLLRAVRERKVNEVKRLLQHPNIDLNCDIGDGNTVFFESLLCNNYEIFSCLIKAGCDVNRPRGNQDRPLHMAVVYSPDSFVQELLKKGADMHAELHYFTPLHLAISLGKTEKACILLYYGTEVGFISGEMTPLVWALKNNNMKVARLLFNYYDGFSSQSDGATDALHDAIKHGNPLAVDILKSCSNKQEYSDCLRYSLMNENAELFRMIWSEFNSCIRLDENFFHDFFDTGTCRYPYYEWLECFHLILNSLTAFEPFMEYDAINEVKLYESEFLPKLIFSLYKRNVPLNDRLAIIYLFLSFGTDITPDLVNLTYLLFGFNEEVEAFLYVVKYGIILHYDDYPAPGLVFVLEESCQLREVSQIFNFFDVAEYYDYQGLSVIENKESIMVSLLGFFSLSSFQKQDILDFCRDHLDLEDHSHVSRKLDTIPEIPSLLELCRNRAREYLNQTYSFKKPYGFYDMVKHLNLPSHIKNILNFRTPLY